MEKVKINIETEDVQEEEFGCWRCVPIEYPQHPKEENDRYEYDIFGTMTMFESPHWLFRRFHKNYCKAVTLFNLEDYSLKKEINENQGFQALIVEETKLHANGSFDVEKIAYHNSIVLLVSALDTFLKNAFLEILSNVVPDKIPAGFTPEKVARKYSFQNYAEIKKSFEWLDNSFNKGLVMGEDESLIEMYIKDIFRFRNRVVHESYYSESLNRDTMVKVSDCVLRFANGFNDYFETKKFYEQIPLPINA